MTDKNLCLYQERGIQAERILDKMSGGYGRNSRCRTSPGRSYRCGMRGVQLALGVPLSIALVALVVAALWR